jgi:hypothetical protein
MGSARRARAGTQVCSVSFPNARTDGAKAFDKPTYQARDSKVLKFGQQAAESSVSSQIGVHSALRPGPTHGYVALRSALNRRPFFSRLRQHHWHRILIFD